MRLFESVLILTVLTEYGSAAKRYWYFGENQLDPLTGMTDNEKESIRYSWEYMMKDPSKYGSMILGKYFKKYPEYLEYFPFKDVLAENLPTNEKFKVYLNLMMYSLDSVIDNLGTDAGIMKAILGKLGKNHFKNNVNVVEPFWDLRDMILEIIQPLVNRSTYDAWVKFLNVTMDNITSAILEEKGGAPRRDLR